MTGEGGASGSPSGAEIGRIEDVTQRYGKATALDGVTLALPAGCMVGLIGPDGVGKSSLLAIIAGARQIQTGKAYVLGGDIADPAHRAEVCAHRLHAAGPRQEPLSRSQHPRKHRVFWPPVRTVPFRKGGPHRRASQEHRACTFRRPSGEKIVGRHEAEARTLLLADPRSRPLDPRRADDRRRPAVAPPVLGADRADPSAALGHERRRRDGLYGGGPAVRLARRNGSRQDPGGRYAGGTRGGNRSADRRGRVHCAPVGAAARRSPRTADSAAPNRRYRTGHRSARPYSPVR